MAKKLVNFFEKVMTKSKKNLLNDDFLDDDGIINLKNLDIQDYGENNDGDWGYRNKVFCRVPSYAFPELVNSTKNNYAYPFKSLVSDGIVPEHVSAILMHEATSNPLKDICASKLLNYFGVNTTYYGLSFYRGRPVVMAVDFLGQGDEILDFNDINMNVFHCKCDELVDKIKSFLSNYYEQHNPDKKEVKKEIERVIEDFLYMFLIRYLILGEGDLFEGNLGFVCNTITNKIEVAPCFDLEKAFNGCPDYVEYKHNIQYIIKNYPHLIKKVKDKIEYLLKNNTYNKLNLSGVLNTDVSSPLHACELQEDWCVSLGNIFDNVVTILKNNLDFINKTQKDFVR